MMDPRYSEQALASFLDSLLDDYFHISVERRRDRDAGTLTDVIKLSSHTKDDLEISRMRTAVEVDRANYPIGKLQLEEALVRMRKAVKR